MKNLELYEEIIGPIKIELEEAKCECSNWKQVTVTVK
jgi:hypothetical protein